MFSNEIRETMSARALPCDIFTLDLKWNEPAVGARVRSRRITWEGALFPHVGVIAVIIGPCLEELSRWLGLLDRVQPIHDRFLKVSCNHTPHATGTQFDTLRAIVGACIALCFERWNWMFAFSWKYLESKNTFWNFRAHRKGFPAKAWSQCK